MVLSLKGQRERRAERTERAVVGKERFWGEPTGSHPAGVLLGQPSLAAGQSVVLQQEQPRKNTTGLSQPHLRNVGTHASLCPPIGGFGAHHGGLHGNGGLGVG